jgi:hypothetical protein
MVTLIIATGALVIAIIGCVLIDPVNRRLNHGYLSTPICCPLPGSGSFPRSEPHDCVPSGCLNV